MLSLSTRINRVSGRPFSPAAPFSPASLFANNEPGIWLDPSDPAALFSDLAGTTQAEIGDPVALVLDKSGNENHATQPVVASRPILGRVPATGRRNVVPSSFGGVWSGYNGSTSLISAVDFDAQGDPYREVIAGTGGNSFSSLHFTLGDGLHVRVRCRVRRGTSDAFALLIGPVSGASGSGYIYLMWESDGLYLEDKYGSAAVEPTVVNISNTEAIVSFGFMTVIDTDHYGLRVYGGGSLSNTSPATSAPEFPGASTLVSELQVTVGSTTDDTPYQRVGSDYDVTEDGVPSLRRLFRDGVDDSLNATLPDLGTDATIAYASDQGITILTGQTIGAGSFNVLRDSWLYGMVANNRPWTDAETTGVTKWLERRMPT